MDETLKQYLERHQIEFISHSHPAVFTVAESTSIKEHIPGLHTKNLFLIDEQGRTYLVCMNAHKRLNIHFLEKHLKVKKLRFGTPEKLKEELNLTPGSVSIFGMIYAKTTKLILDLEVWDAEITGFHPNINTATLEISHPNLARFFESLPCEKEIVALM